MFYRVVSFGGSVNGADGIYASEEEAVDLILRAERDTMCGGQYATDESVLQKARVYGYPTRDQAEHADISDGSRRGQQKPATVRVLRG